MLNSSVHSKYWHFVTQTVAETDTVLIQGRVSSVEGLLIRAKYITPSVGSICRIGDSVYAEVISVNKDECLLIGYDSVNNIKVMDTVVLLRDNTVKAGEEFLGRVIDGFGHALDRKDAIMCTDSVPLINTPPGIMERPLITQQLCTGVKVIDAFTPLGTGQRIGCFSGSGVGKSVLLGMMARNSSAEVNIVALVGERTREAKEMIEYNIGSDSMKNTIVLVAASNESAALRIRCAYYACALAEYFRDSGKDVMLYMDSLTRVAHAQREIGLLRGEFPAARGYPSSLYGVLSSILERCGTNTHGSITGIFTVLVEGDDQEEPVTDVVRGMLDGHIILSRELSEQSYYPAVDITRSLSRVATKVQSAEIQQAISKIRQHLGLYEQSKDIINAGVYTSGTNKTLDVFLAVKDDFDEFVQQNIDDRADLQSTQKQIIEFAERL